MKIAEALLLRADIKKKLASSRTRIGTNAVVQEGEQPHEDPNQLIKETFASLGELEDLVCRINRANHENKLPDGRSLSQALAHRDTMIEQHSLLSHAVAQSVREPDRYSRKEIKWVATMKVKGLQKQIEDLAKKIRQLNGAIQETNWKTELPN